MRYFARKVIACSIGIWKIPIRPQNSCAKCLFCLVVFSFVVSNAVYVSALTETTTYAKSTLRPLAAINTSIGQEINIRIIKDIVDQTVTALKEEGKEGIEFGVTGFRSASLNELIVAVITQAVADYIKEDGLENKVFAVCKDTREKGDIFTKIASVVFAANGIKMAVSDGYTPTPVIAYTVVHNGYGGAINFTASHSPKAYKGYKLITVHGGAATVEATDIIQKKANDYLDGLKSADGIRKASGSVYLDAVLDYKSMFKAFHDSGDIEFIEPMESYVEYLFNLEVQGKKIFDKVENSPIMAAASGLHGTAGPYFERIFGPKGLNVLTCEVLNKEPREDFGRFNSPAATEKNLQDLIKVVTSNNQTLGVAGDGDGDRTSAIDINGRFVTANELPAIFYWYLHEIKGLRGGVVKTVATTNRLNALADKFNERCYEKKVGFKNFKDEMLSGNVIVAAESSGHMGINTISWDDTFLCALLSYQILSDREGIRAKTGMEFNNLTDILHYIESKVVGNYFSFYESKIKADEATKKLLLNWNQNPDLLTEQLGKAEFLSILESSNLAVTGAKISTLPKKGVKVVFKDGSWLCLRPSGGAQPLIRLYAESSGRPKAVSSRKKEVLARLAERLLEVDKGRSILKKLAENKSDTTETKKIVNNLVARLEKVKQELIGLVFSADLLTPDLANQIEAKIGKIKRAIIEFNKSIESLKVQRTDKNKIVKLQNSINDVMCNRNSALEGPIFFVQKGDNVDYSDFKERVEALVDQIGALRIILDVGRLDNIGDYWISGHFDVSTLLSLADEGNIAVELSSLFASQNMLIHIEAERNNLNSLFIDKQLTSEQKKAFLELFDKELCFLLDSTQQGYNIMGSMILIFKNDKINKENFVDVVKRITFLVKLAGAGPKESGSNARCALSLVSYILENNGVQSEEIIAYLNEISNWITEVSKIIKEEERHPIFYTTLDVIGKDNLIMDNLKHKLDYVLDIARTNPGNCSTVLMRSVFNGAPIEYTTSIAAELTNKDKVLKHSSSGTLRDFPEISHTIRLKDMPRLQRVMAFIGGNARMRESVKKFDKYHPEQGYTNYTEDDLSIPDILYYTGDKNAINASLTLSLIGTTSPSSDGSRISEMLAQAAARDKWVIVSGGVPGIDTAAHLGALDENSQTVAVIGGALQFPDELFYFPPRRKYIEKGIIDLEGAFISEYRDDNYILSKEDRIMARDRITSALSDIVVVVESGKDRGTIDCAKRAYLQGKKVYAIDWERIRLDYPANIKSDGNKQLFDEGIADRFPLKKVESFQELKSEFLKLLKLEAVNIGFPSADNFIDKTIIRLKQQRLIDEAA